MDKKLEKAFETNDKNKKKIEQQLEERERLKKKYSPSKVVSSIGSGLKGFKPKARRVKPFSYDQVVSLKKKIGFR